MIRVQAPSRLHFGLLSLPGEGSGQASIHRCFGGVGLMVAEPGLCVSVRPAEDWSAEGPLAERALNCARCFADALWAKHVRPQRIVVDKAPADHIGLGTGTQLALAVGRALAVAHGLEKLDTSELARALDRGARSALGIHGFEHGGFLVEGGKKVLGTVSPLVGRMAFPESWRIVLVIPSWGQGLHGPNEQLAFARLQVQGIPPDVTDVLCRLVLLGMLPALAEEDITEFSKSIHEFNALVGDAFSVAQGGRYAHPRLAEVVAFIRQQGFPGVGQSSWGPTLFAIAENEEKAAWLADLVQERFQLTDEEVLVTAACNSGATVDF